MFVSLVDLRMDENRKVKDIEGVGFLTAVADNSMDNSISSRTD